MSDEIYKLMAKNLIKIKKFSAPIEGFFDADTTEEYSGKIYEGKEEGKVDDADRYFSDVSHTTDEYIDYAKNISEKIFVFTFDPYDMKNEFGNKLYKYFFHERREKSGYFWRNGWPKVEMVKDISMLNDFPEIKNKIEQEISKSGESLNDVIVIIMSSGGKDEESQQNRNPLFSIHDLLHAYEDMLEVNAEITSLIESAYSDCYANRSGRKMDLSVAFDEDEVFRKITNKPFGVWDWSNHIFSMSLKEGSGYLIFPEKFYSKALDSYFYFNPENSISDDRDVCRTTVEEKIKDISENIISQLKGKVLFNII